MADAHWQAGGNYGNWGREILSADGCRHIGAIRTKRIGDGGAWVSWPEGQQALALAVAAPKLLAALKAVFADHDCVNRTRWLDQAAEAIADAEQVQP